MIHRIPVSDFPNLGYDDPDVVSAFQWLRAFMSDEEWERRKNGIEAQISYDFRLTKPFSEPLTEGTLLAVHDDQIGWYLYLVYCLLFEDHKYEYYQGARVVPIFKQIGMNLNLLKQIDGINRKVRDLVKNRPSTADAVLFEILTALLWARNGWSVSLLPEGKAGKTPDIMVTKGLDQWQVECKRHKKTSDYTYRESAKRQSMVSPLGKILIARNIILDVTFHVEIFDLPDTYLRDLIEDKIRNMSSPGLLVSNDIVEVKMDFVDIPKIRDYFKSRFIKDHSPDLLDIVAQRPVDHRSFSSGYRASFFRVGEGSANNLFISDISHAFGIHWKNDSPKAINAKARDVKQQISDAIRQFKPDSRGVIHIGIETFDGPEVESLRVQKILSTIEGFDPRESNLRWLYFHFFQSYSRPDQFWIIDETVQRATAYIDPTPPLAIEHILLPDDVQTLNDIAHWDRDLP